MVDITNAILPSGEFMRKDSVFRNFITADGSSGFKAEANRYHLYVSLACPWAHRTLIVRSLKGLTDVIGVSVVDYLMVEGKGWVFNPQRPGATEDHLYHFQTLRQLYELAAPGYDGRVTVPVLWDKEKKTIVNNESAEIIRMLNSEFNAFCPTEDRARLDLYPQPLRAQIDELNAWIYKSVNSGVYRAGFARSQDAYVEGATDVFSGLDRLEALLADRRYLAGYALTEADVRLFTTLVRFDCVYVGHFKCNVRRIVDYPNLWAYTRDIYQTESVKKTVDFVHIKHHYYESHPHVNPSGVVPIGPNINWLEPVHRP